MSRKTLFPLGMRDKFGKLMATGQGSHDPGFFTSPEIVSIYIS
jgi:hypothetical protein